MPNSDQFSSPQDIFSHQESPVMTQRPRGGVWQDKGANFSGRVPSSRPASDEKRPRAEPLATKTDRYQKLSTPGVPLVPMTVWVHPLIKAEIHRTAQLESLATGEYVSASKVGAGYLEYAVRQDIHQQQDALLKPMLKQIIREEFRAFGNRIVFFLM